MKIKVSCVQMEPKLFDVQYNLNKMINLITEVMEKENETDLIVFPELYDEITKNY